ncbi:hypothetical protein MTBBW1_20040 [Desulfamplus magnetovallimortis]|uniref:Uncharacterized protein n=1 Tax=Desulfamplus magnetovallimortis TaxID=1246637 RepID=A0A1W1HBM7_9BACT|nr:hypothetical protein MTBBW1_20040 [Desulfamplus magnetovallimortis]
MITYQSSPNIKMIVIFGMLHLPFYTLQGSNLIFKDYFSKKCKVLLIRYEGRLIFTVNWHGCHPATPE